jgi:hypothetical protein
MMIRFNVGQANLSAARKWKQLEIFKASRSSWDCQKWLNTATVIERLVGNPARKPREGLGT